MKSSEKRTGSRRAKLGLSALCVIAVSVAMLPASSVGAPATSARDGKATFDLYSMFPEQMLSPSTGRTSTFMPLETRNIGGRGSGEVTLCAAPESGYFTADVNPAKVDPGGRDGKVKSRVNISCEKNTPEGTVGYVKVTGRRGSEQHRVWLKVNVLASSPSLELSRGVPFTGQGRLDAELQPYTGKPLTWHISAKNTGGDEDTFELGYKAGFPCRVTFRNINGRKVDSVKVKGKTRNLLFARPAELTAEVVPEGGLPRNKPQDLTLVLGPGKNTGKTSEIKVQVLNPGELFCVNDLDGIRPHPHQVMPSEATSFVFHVSNTGDRPEDVKLSLNGDTARWLARLGKADVKGLKPGQTEGVALKMTAPRDAAPGERAEFTVTAEAGKKREDVTVAAEVTDSRNIYFWSVDSMDPEYMYLDRAGTGPGRDGDWLMPNTHAFLKQGANYTDARAYLPSATDMNHTNALAGTYTGTQGIYMVGGTFNGFTEHDEVLSGNNSMSLMRYGPDGKPIERVYEVAKQQTGGKALTGFWSNKNWLAEIEGERGVDIVGHSERWPLFFEPPPKYRATGDPLTDSDPGDPLSATPRCVFHSNNANAVVLPTVLGQFDLYNGFRMLNTPMSLLFGRQPGMHEEDRYIYNEFERSIVEEDPDVAYINVADLDNTGHFTGASWPQDEWLKSGKGTAYDQDKYSPWIRRDECLDIACEADVLFGRFLGTLKARGVYDNSTIVLLSDHGMENMKDPAAGYEVIDLRQILRDSGYLRFEDYNEAGGTEMNLVWCDDAKKTADIQRILEGYTIDDPKLGKVHPLIVINRSEMKDGKDFGEAGRVLPGELYSEYWVNNPDPVNGEQWPDLFVFPQYNYQVMAHGDALSSGINNVGFNLGINVPEQVRIGLPAAHGGLKTEHIPLVLKAPAGIAGYAGVSENPGTVGIGDIAPTIYGIMGWPVPACVDGKPLPAK